VEIWIERKKGGQKHGVQAQPKRFALRYEKDRSQEKEIESNNVLILSLTDREVRDI
jgi:hypothetical protein